MHNTINRTRSISRLNSGIKNCYNFFIHAKFYFRLLDWITLNLRISKVWSDSLKIRIWIYCSDFEIALVAPICVGNFHPRFCQRKSKNLSRFTIWKFKSLPVIWVSFSIIFKAVLFGPYDMGHIISYGLDDSYGSFQIVLRNDTHILQ